MSCGPASVAMTEVYYTSRIRADLELRMRELSQKYPGKFTEIGGTGMGNLVNILREEGIKTYDLIYAKDIWAYIYAYAKDNTPLILHVQWANGAHFIVCPCVYKADQKVIFLDPWYGLVELAGSSLPDYVGGDPTGTFGPVAKGKLSGWIIITKR